MVEFKVMYWLARTVGGDIWAVGGGRDERFRRGKMWRVDGL